MDFILSTVSYNCQRVLSWFKDDVFRRLFFNAGKLLSAHTFSAVLGIVLTALTARALGPENYGFLALVLVYEQTIGKLVSFNAWQAVIKFGSERLQANDRERLRQLIKFGFCLDVGSAIVGTLLAMALASPVIALLGWDQALRPSLVLFSWLILFTLNGTPIGILRLFNRFDLLSYASIFRVIVRLLGVGWCLLTNQGLHGFVWVYLITGIVGQLYQILASLWELRKQGVGNFVAQSLRGVRRIFPGIWDYVWTTNLNSTIRMLSRESDELIIAGLTTPTALGLFHVAKQFSRVLPMLTDPLYQSIYPELTRLWSVGDRKYFLSLIKRTTLIVASVALVGWLGFLVFGNWLITLTVGIDYLDAYVVTVVYMFALVIALCGFSLQPSMLAIGEPRKSFVVQLISTVLYLILLFPIVRLLGITGAAVTYVVYYLAWTGLMIKYLKPHIFGANYG
jgi:O-antigen/teichoic acid export membrane protein